MTDVNLGMPQAPGAGSFIRAANPPTHGGQCGSRAPIFPVSVQSMTTTPTHDVNATLQQIAETSGGRL